MEEGAVGAEAGAKAARLRLTVVPRPQVEILRLLQAVKMEAAAAVEAVTAPTTVDPTLGTHRLALGVSQPVEVILPPDRALRRQALVGTTALPQVIPTHPVHPVALLAPNHRTQAAVAKLIRRRQRLARLPRLLERVRVVPFRTSARRPGQTLTLIMVLALQVCKV